MNGINWVAYETRRTTLLLHFRQCTKSEGIRELYSPPPALSQLLTALSHSGCF